MYILNGLGDITAVIDEYMSIEEKSVFSPSRTSCGSIAVEVPSDLPHAVSTGDWIHTSRGDYCILRTRISSESGSFRLWGEEASALLAFAIIPSDIVLHGKPSELICGLIREHGAAVLPMPIGEIVYASADEESIDITAHAGALLDVISELCVLGGLGISIGLSSAAKGKLSVIIKHMRDVRVGTNDAVILSEQYENIDDIISECDHGDYRNRAFVRGLCDPDGNEQHATVSASEAWLGERWIYIDEPIPLSRYTSGGSFSSEAYVAALAEIGRLELLKRRPKLSLYIELGEDTARKLQLGDLCSVRSDKLKLLCDAVCTEKHMTTIGGAERCRATLYLDT